MQITSESTVAPTRRLVSADLGEEVILLHLENGLYYGLENVGARIWKLLQNPVKVGEIESALLDEYVVEPETCLAEVVTLLQRLIDQNLVEVTGP